MSIRGSPGGAVGNGAATGTGGGDALRGLTSTITIPKAVQENGSVRHTTERIQVKLSTSAATGANNKNIRVYNLDVNNVATVEFDFLACTS